MVFPPSISMRARPLGERGRGFPQTHARSPAVDGQRELDPGNVHAAGDQAEHRGQNFPSK